jgi:hypothetical protein
MILRKIENVIKRSKHYVKNDNKCWIKQSIMIFIFVQFM